VSVHPPCRYQATAQYACSRGNNRKTVGRVVFYALRVVSKESNQSVLYCNYRRGTNIPHVSLHYMFRLDGAIFRYIGVYNRLFPFLLLSSTTSLWSWVPTGAETKNDCAGEGQMQFTAILCPFFPGLLVNICIALLFLSVSLQ
jgi:hypothetical protein